MTVNVLGTQYSVTITNDVTEPRLTECDGFCDETTHELFAEDYQTHKDDKQSKKCLDVQTRKVIRHEIIHAFLFESGLAENSDWARNEEMVDWFAKQGPKIYAAWKEIDAL